MRGLETGRCRESHRGEARLVAEGEALATLVVNKDYPGEVIDHHSPVILAIAETIIEHC